MNRNRIYTTQIIFMLAFITIVARLFYWQVISGAELQTIATQQRQSRVEVLSKRGEILSSDGFPLVTNQPAYLVFAYTPDIEIPSTEISDQLKELLAPKPEDIGATPSAEVRQELVDQTYEELRQKLDNPKLSWIPLKRQINQDIKNAIEALEIKGIGFDEFQIRSYPEASMAAQLVGFVGSDGAGSPKGYFGIEGEYDLELRGKNGILAQEKDALGNPIAVGDFDTVTGRDGRTLVTHIHRSLQLLVERELKAALERYQAVSGEVVIMQPKTGAIITLASFPNYDPANHRLYPNQYYRIPAIADTYEPGSTFKAMVMAAALDANKITPETVCDQTCDGPVTIGKYTIRTWNNQYTSGQTMTDVLRHSDNTGMIFVARQLGKDTFVDYLKRFGFGSFTGIDLEAEATTVLRERWGDIDLATGSFGQGLAVTSIQMMQAMGAIANGGVMMQPQLVDKVISETGEIDIAPRKVGTPISAKAASQMAEMLHAAAESGEAQWAVPEGYKLAGKTGTAQIPIAGHYDAQKTVASFVGFAPYDNPQFVMLVKLREPQASPWASETAAPLWFNLAKDIFRQLELEGTEF